MTNVFKECKMKKIFIKTSLITDYIKGNNLTIKQFCQICNIKYYNYSQIMRCNGNVKVDILYMICKVASIKLDELLGINQI